MRSVRSMRDSATAPLDVRGRLLGDAALMTRNPWVTVPVFCTAKATRPACTVDGVDLIVHSATSTVTASSFGRGVGISHPLGSIGPLTSESPVVVDGAVSLGALPTGSPVA